MIMTAALARDEATGLDIWATASEPGSRRPPRQEARMRLGKLLSVGEVVEQPPVEEPPAAWPELTELGAAAATADDEHAQAPVAARADR
jgi:hypothetical protein